MKRLLTLPLAVLCVFLYVRCSKESSPADRHVDLGRIYLDAGGYDEAIAEFKKAISVNPNSLRAYNGLGLVYSEQGKYDLAVRFYQKLTQRMQWFITTWGMSTRRNSSVT